MTFETQTNVILRYVERNAVKNTTNYVINRIRVTFDNN